MDAATDISPVNMYDTINVSKVPTTLQLKALATLRIGFSPTASSL